ncbi:MAG TPA: formate dehydrogenase accessory sulfurtransferase FdhD [Smithellaceae bacterium]|nr:formate dehydrogenase accessory sulfurtransferase FdhD [Smithellaceae bacterium]HRS89577.1 formate dehydrogenase accessory sulfurtransferase FdhD [Smithellaceae bacterium]HRV26362.1 formate dehydrogenase accessory sulfurtransferase FdhD [Smithellaceae bacterium]
MTNNRPVKTMPIFSAGKSSLIATQAKIIEEIALKIYLHGRLVANIACAGNHLDELALGFLRAERIIHKREQVSGINVDEINHSVCVELKNGGEFSGASFQNIASSGARGHAHLDALTPLPDATDLQINSGTILRLMEELLEGSEIHNETHGTHCSALARGDKIFVLREDIGRHNTIDMLGGYCLWQDISPADALILTTGRISSEIVYKIWNLRVPVIVSHSAPTTKAVELVKKANITLIGYVRGEKMNIYSQERRVII